MNAKASKSFGKIVLEVRFDQGLTLNQLVSRSGVSKGNLSNIENGKGNPSLDTIVKLAKALNITVHINGTN